MPFRVWMNFNAAMYDLTEEGCKRLVSQHQVVKALMVLMERGHSDFMLCASSNFLNML